jgi:hypothetical protein
LAFHGDLAAGSLLLEYRLGDQLIEDRTLDAVLVGAEPEEPVPELLIELVRADGLVANGGHHIRARGWLVCGSCAGGGKADEDHGNETKKNAHQTPRSFSRA